MNESHSLAIPKYNTINNNRQNKRARGGGTAILLKKGIYFTEVRHPPCTNFKLLEFTIAKIILVNNDKTTYSCIVAIYASNRLRNEKLFLYEFSSLFNEMKLSDPNHMYIIAGDLNARHTLLGDRANNGRGIYLLDWMEEFNHLYRAKLYPSCAPTYMPAQTMLDICIANSKLNINNAANNPALLLTLDFDSDHKAILITRPKTTSMAHDESADKDLCRNYKRLNWKKFNTLLVETHKSICPKNRNLSADEIDYYISELTVSINKTLDMVSKQAMNKTVVDYLFGTTTH